MRAIAQGASERNISVVVDGKHATRALRAVHAGLYLSPHTISIGVIGPGTVGRVLLDQLASQSARLREQFKLDLRVRGIMASKRMLLAEAGVPLEQLARAVRASAARGRPRSLRRARARRLPAAHGHHRLHGERRRRQALSRLARRRHPRRHAEQEGQQRRPRRSTAACTRRAARAAAHYLYEATVGAGLPVVQTLRDLRETGDEITSVEGIFSGTLAYLFNIYDGTHAVLRHRARCAAARLHRARSAR